MDGNVAQHLAINFDVGLFQTICKLAVGQAALTRGCIDSGDPQLTEHALFRPTIPVGVLPSLHHRLFGDTEDIAEMRALKNIDVAFVCMNLPYTMEVEQAASAVLEFQPKVVYAFHYRGKDGFADTEKFKKLVNEKNKKIDVRLLNWYAGS